MPLVVWAPRLCGKTQGSTKYRRKGSHRHPLPPTPQLPTAQQEQSGKLALILRASCVFTTQTGRPDHQRHFTSAETFSLSTTPGVDSENVSAEVKIPLVVWVSRLSGKKCKETRNTNAKAPTDTLCHPNPSSQR